MVFRVRIAEGWTGPFRGGSVNGSLAGKPAKLNALAVGSLRPSVFANFFEALKDVSHRRV